MIATLLGKLVPRLLVTFSTIWLWGCASSEVKKPFDFRDEQMTTLTEQLDFQGKKIANLTAEIDDLKKRLREAAPKRTTTVGRKKRTGKTAVETPAPLEDVPENLTVNLPEDRPEDREGKLDPAIEGEVIADSSFETMHLYFQAVQLARAKKLEEAVESLRRFLAANPHHIYADEAQYLMARYLYESREYQLSVVAANQLVSRFPHSFRLPEAIYYRSLSQKGMGNHADGAAGLHDLVKRFPKEPVSQEATAVLEATKPRPSAETTRRAQVPALLDSTQN